MTKFYQPKKQKPQPQRPEMWNSLRACDQVVFNLNNGASVEALIDDLEEDEDVIFGVTTDGRNFAIPRASVAYVVEGV